MRPSIILVTVLSSSLVTACASDSTDLGAGDSALLHCPDGECAPEEPPEPEPDEPPPPDDPGDPLPPPPAPLPPIPQVSIVAPASGQVHLAPLCSGTPSECPADVLHRVRVDAAGPIDAVFIDYLRNGELYQSAVICQDAPPGSFEWPMHLECPDPGQPWDFDFTIGPDLPSGTWSSRVTVRDKLQRTTAPVEVDYVVVAPNQPSVGAMKLVDITPRIGAGPLILRQSPTTTRAADEVKVLGLDLHANPFLQVYFTPIPSYDPTWSPEGGFPTADWCKYPASIVKREAAVMTTHPSCPGSTAGAPATCPLDVLTVAVPEIPDQVRRSCAPGATALSRAFDLDWRVVVHDPWGRPTRIHDDEAIPSPYLQPSLRQPPFRLGPADFPGVFGFGFHNTATARSLSDFLATYGDSAYLFWNIQNPLYLLFYPIHRAWLWGSGGNCVGMASTSQMMARGWLSSASYDPDVSFPAGFSSHGPDLWSYTPRAQPASIWAEIMRNHGVQTSDEFVSVYLSQIDIHTQWTDLGSQLATLRAAPHRYVLCGARHCVTPFAVEGNEIKVYDNVCPGQTSTWTVDVAANTWSRTCTTTSGHRAMFLLPIALWRQPRHIVGLGALASALAIPFGSADVMYHTADGDLGYQPGDPALVDTMTDGFQAELFGTDDHGRAQGPMILPAGSPIDVDAVATGGDYGLYFGGSRVLYRVDVPAAAPGRRDHVHLDLEDGDPGPLTFTAPDDGVAFQPVVGLVPADDERAVFTARGVVPRGDTIVRPLRERRGLALTNLGDRESTFDLEVDAADVSDAAAGKVRFPTVTVPAGATLSLWLNDWPTFTRLSWMLDLDGDGTPEESGTLDGASAG